MAATSGDRLNKRFYARLQSGARSNPALAEVLAQITTESGNLLGTLGIRTILQGGADGLQLLIFYDNGFYDGSATNLVEWMVAGTDPEFTHQIAAITSGSALGPFASGQTVKLRTPVTNANGTTTGSVRTLVMRVV